MDESVQGTRLPDPSVQSVISVAEAARVLGLGRSAAYEAVRRGDIPHIRIGRRLLVPVARMRALLGETSRRGHEHGER